MKSRESARKGEYNFITNSALILGLMVGITLGSVARLLYNSVSSLEFLLPNQESVESVEVDSVNP